LYDFRKDGDSDLRRVRRAYGKANWGMYLLEYTLLGASAEEALEPCRMCLAAAECTDVKAADP
jgi:tRNA(Arg) A34 adenosine deaminase TadA